MPKVDGWPPRFCTFDPTGKTRSRGPEAAEFINNYARVTKQSVGGRAGDLITLRPWQHQLLDGLLAEGPDGRLLHRAALIGMARKNGKSALGAGLALWGLLLGEDGGEVYSCAGTRDQAKIVFGSAKRMVELDEELSASVKVYRDALEVPTTGSVYRVLSREAGASEGLSPTLVIFDEVHVQPDAELWDVMQLGMGARLEPLLLGITTAGARTDSHGADSHCYSLYQHGKRVVSGEVADPSFYFAWWEPKLGAAADHRDPNVWREGNPGFGDLNSVEDFESTLVRTSEAEYRTKRTNVFTAGTTSALPFGSWSALTDTGYRRDPSTQVVLMADGSWSGDSTAIVGITVEENPHAWVVGLWERPANDREWRVPIADVTAKIRETCAAMPVVEVGMDPYRWQQAMQELENEGIPMLEYPMGSVERMVKAWKSFFDAVLDKQISHSGEPALARHVEAMVLKYDARGARPVKDSKMSERHIDLGVCVVAGVERALWWSKHPAYAAEADFLVF